MIPTSATLILFEINTLIRYPAGAINNVKKYNQNPFLINFCPNGWSANNSPSIKYISALKNLYFRNQNDKFSFIFMV